MSTNICNLVDYDLDNINVVCNVAEGFENELILINRADIDWSSVSYDTDYPSVVNGFALKDGKKGAFVFQLKKPFQGTQTSLSEGDFRSFVTNTVAFNIWSSDPLSAKQLQAILNGNFVAITRQRYKGASAEALVDGGAEYRIYGLENGLECSAMDNDPYSDSVGNAWNITLTEAKSSMPMYFLIAKNNDTYSASATATLYESLADRD